MRTLSSEPKSSLRGNDDGSVAVKRRLSEIEKEHGITILYAAELGSRAWGFAHPESDYDVKFLYIRKLSAYLNIFGIDPTVMDENNGLARTEIFDFVGWDAYKALGLAVKSNPAILEWFNSPVVYVRTEEAEKVGRLAMMFFCELTARRYYRQIAWGNLHKYFAKTADLQPLQQVEVHREKYLHVIRPLLMIRWLEENHSPNVPVSLPDLLEDQAKVLPTGVKHIIQGLIEEKRQNKLGMGPNNSILDEWAWEESNQIIPPGVRQENDPRAASALFQELVLPDLN
jgi:predicted nucleotidyltransferase